MIPSKYYDTSGCDSVSSNCVVWQGPTLDCIGVCNGDSVSTIVAKMAERICEIVDSGCVEGEGTDSVFGFNVNEVVLDCLEAYIVQNGIPTPETLTELLQIIVGKICQINSVVSAPDCCRSFVPLPECLHFEDPTTGNITTQLLLVDYVQYLGTQICAVAEAAGLPGQTPWGLQVAQDIAMLKRQSKATTYTPPKVIPKYIGPNKGKQTDMNIVISDVEKDYGVFKASTGGTSAIREAAKRQPLNLSGSTRLNGAGPYNAMAGWTANPTNLAQSFGNAWLTIGDMRTAIVDLQSTTRPTNCSSAVYDFSVSLLDSSKVVNGVKITFPELVVPTGYVSCDKSKGCKVTIKDSSLTTLINYCFPEQLISSNEGFLIKELGQLDTASNFEVTVDFCFTDGASECGRTITKTLTNNVLCPTITTSSITSEGFSYSIAGINNTQKQTVTVIIEDSSGTALQTVPYTSPSTIITGSMSGLVSGATYSIYTKFTSTAGNVTTCDATTVTTSIPTCTTEYKETGTFTTDYADFRAGATKLTLSCYNDGVNTTEVIAGFDSSNNFITYKGTAGGGTCTAGTLVTYGSFISDDPTQQLTCSGINYAATGITSSMSTSGWQYVDALVSPSKVTHYIYAKVDASSNAVTEVVSCCDCAGVYITDKTPASANDANKIYYVAPAASREITLDIVGNVGKTDPIWTIDRAPKTGTVTYLETSADKKTATFKYTSPGAGTVWTSDSFKISVKNDCGTSASLTVPILRAQTIPRTDTDINIFLDTTSTVYATAADIKTSLESVKGSLQKVCPTWTGTFNYIPINGSTAGDWGKCVKALVDMKAGGTGSVTVDSSGSWGAWQSLPAYWTGGSTKSIPLSAFNIVFTNQGNTNGTYASSSLTNGWGTPTQPTDSGGVGTDKYQQDYDGILDMLDYNAATKSAWATGKSINATVFPSGFAQIIVPIVTGPQNASAATVLQIAGAILGETIPIERLDGLKTGNTQYPINLKNYLLTGTAPVPVPYNVTTSGAGREMVGLQQHGFTMASFFENGDDFTTAQFKNLMLSIMGVIDSRVGLSCPATPENARNMLGASAEYLYGTAATCDKSPGGGACDEADGSPGTLIEIYNSTGNLFDTAVPAFLSKQGVIAKTAVTHVDELTNGHWYAVYDGSSSGARRVAQYSRTAPYWVNEKACSTC
jgi:hypothetical protein